MKKNLWIVSVFILVALGYFESLKWSEHKAKEKDQALAHKQEISSYWTCPMHPQIHSDKPGECPICHMKLVQVKAQPDHATSPQEIENRSEVVAGAYQKQLLGIQKHTVEKMDLTVHIPVSGRIISSTTVAFQVYEGDLRYVKPGLSFSGESSFIPESEILGTISSVDSIVDPTSRTVRVVGNIRKGPQGLISETTFRGDIAVELRNVIAIPESSVLHTGSGGLVYIFSGDEALKAVPVKLGQKTESYYEILSGLKAGDTISSGPNFLIDSEAKIRGTSGHSHH